MPKIVSESRQYVKNKNMGLFDFISRQSSSNSSRREKLVRRFYQLMYLDQYSDENVIVIAKEIFEIALSNTGRPYVDPTRSFSQMEVIQMMMKDSAEYNYRMVVFKPLCEAIGSTYFKMRPIRMSVSSPIDECRKAIDQIIAGTERKIQQINIH